MMTLPDYWLPRPESDWSDAVTASLERIYQKQIAPGGGGWIDEDLPVAKWAFLCWLSDDKGLLLHGSGDPDIRLFQPRTPVDNSPDDFSELRNPLPRVVVATDG